MFARPASTAVRVHVDDLAVGHLPPLCAITGRPSTDLVHFEEQAREFRAWWLLLLLFGPFGIAAIVLLYLFARPGRGAGGLIPLHDSAIDAYNDLLRAGRRWALTFGIGFVAALGLTIIGGNTDQPSLTAAFGTLAAIAAVAAISSLFIAEAIAQRRWLSLELDGSGRWVLVRGVHPDFARSVIETARRAEQRARP